jgi:hypothetical protein
LNPDTQAVINRKTNYTIADWADIDAEATETVRRNLANPEYRADLDSFLPLSCSMAVQTALMRAYSASTPASARCGGLYRKQNVTPRRGV